VSTRAADNAIPGGAARLISCVLPDDGTERLLLHWLRDEAGITRADSVYCRGHSIVREAVGRRGRLPEPSLVRLVRIVLDAEAADALFEQIYEQAQIHRPGGGAMLMTTLTFATPFPLPTAVPYEPGD